MKKKRKQYKVNYKQQRGVKEVKCIRKQVGFKFCKRKQFGRMDEKLSTWKILLKEIHLASLPIELDLDNNLEGDKMHR